MSPSELLDDTRILSKRYRVLVTRAGSSAEVARTVYQARVGLRALGEVGFASVEVSAGETVRIRVEVTHGTVQTVQSRPSHEAPAIFLDSPSSFSFEICKPQKLSLVINGDTLNTLHLFADFATEQRSPTAQAGVRSYGPGMHLIPGDGFLRMKSGETLFLDEGAVLVGKGIVCDNVRDVDIFGRGIVDLSPWRPEDAQDNTRPDTRGVDVQFSQRIQIEGITFLNPNHYTIFLGQSEDVRISNIKSFSSAQWADGIDCMSSKRLNVDNVFLRTSDDCIAIYGHRWKFFGDTSDVTVTNSQLWADVAHPVLIGTHGLHEGDGDRIERISLRNLDILLHDEILEEYQGTMAVNAGDNNTVRDIAFEDVFIEEVRQGQIFNVRVFQNEDYNPIPGKSVERVRFKNVRYAGPDKRSLLAGFAPERLVREIVFENCFYNGQLIDGPADANIEVGEFTEDIQFLCTGSPRTGQKTPTGGSMH
jgi:hypothetical protein